MSFPIGNVPVGNSTNFDAIRGQISEIRSLQDNAVQLINDGLSALSVTTTNANSVVDTWKAASQIMDLPALASPAFGTNANDISLKIALLQDALAQLQTEVSKMGINQRVQEQMKSNLEELDKLKENFAKQAEATAKSKEAEKKGNIIDAISNWVQAAIAIVSAVVNIISAVGMGVAALFSGGTSAIACVALIVSAGALLVQAGGNIALAIDSTMKACGTAGGLGAGFDRKACEKVVEVAGYIALAAGMVGLVGGIGSAAGSAAKSALTAGGKAAGEVAKMSTAQAVKAVVTEAMEQAFKAVQSAVKALMNDFIGTLRTAMNSVKDSIVSSVREGVAALRSEAQALSAKLGEALKAASAAAKEASKTTLSDVGKAAKEAVVDALKAMKDSIDEIITVLKNLKPEEWGDDMINAVKDAGTAIKDAPGDALKAMRDVLARAKEAMAGSPLAATADEWAAAGVNNLANQSSGRAAGLIVKEGGNAIILAPLERERLELVKKADEALAQAKAIHANIERLMALIEQMQQELEDAVADTQETMAIIMRCIGDTDQSMQGLVETATA
jgi:hypothetical protein